MLTGLHRALNADVLHALRAMGPGAVPQVHLDAQTAEEAAGETRKIPAVERFAFYELAKQAYVIIQTGERRPSGNVMLRKGVVGPEGKGI